MFFSFESEENSYLLMGCSTSLQWANVTRLGVEVSPFGFIAFDNIASKEYFQRGLVSRSMLLATPSIVCVSCSLHL
jgi:hypothetical protein